MNITNKKNANWKSFANVDETYILEIIDDLRNFKAVIYAMEKDESLYYDICIAVEEQPTNLAADMECTLARYLEETLENFDEEDSENWWMTGCRACLDSWEIA